MGMRDKSSRVGVLVAFGGVEVTSGAREDILERGWERTLGKAEEMKMVL